jgi:hypothetical protein
MPEMKNSGSDAVTGAALSIEVRRPAKEDDQQTDGIKGKRPTRVRLLIEQIQLIGCGWILLAVTVVEKGFIHGHFFEWGEA